MYCAFLSLSTFVSRLPSGACLVRLDLSLLVEFPQRRREVQLLRTTGGHCWHLDGYDSPLSEQAHRGSPAIHIAVKQRGSNGESNNQNLLYTHRADCKHKTRVDPARRYREMRHTFAWCGQPDVLTAGL